MVFCLFCYNHNKKAIEYNLTLNNVGYLLALHLVVSHNSPYFYSCIKTNLY